MLIQLNRLLPILLLALLTGCAGKSTIQVAEEIQVELPDDVLTDADIYSEEATLEFEAAIKVLKKGNTEDAESLFIAYIEKHPLVAGGHLNMALIEHQKGQLDAAHKYVDQAIELSPRNAVAYNLKGRLQREQGAFLEARISYTKALVADPEYASAHLNIAILYDIYLQYLLNARTHYQKYLDLNGADSKRVKQWLQDLEYRIKLAGG